MDQHTQSAVPEEKRRQATLQIVAGITILIVTSVVSTFAGLGGIALLPFFFVGIALTVNGFVQRIVASSRTAKIVVTILLIIIAIYTFLITLFPQLVDKSR